MIVSMSWGTARPDELSSGSYTQSYEIFMVALPQCKIIPSFFPQFSASRTKSATVGECAVSVQYGCLF